jgi:hypothetical protein
MPAHENLKQEDLMQYDPLVEILNVAENSVEHAGEVSRTAKPTDSAKSGPEPE